MKNHKNKFRKPAPKTQKTPDFREKTAPHPSQKRADLYGFHAVCEAWCNPARDIQALYFCDQALKSFEPHMEKARILGLNRPVPTQLEKKQLEALLPQGAVHQGLAIACKPLEELQIEDLIIQGHGLDKHILLILDQVTDPHNVGAILRSACAFGAHGVILQKKHAPELTGVLAKTACGALEHIPVAMETNLSRTIETLQEAGYFVYGLDERGPRTIGETDLASRAVLVLGAEGAGLRPLVKEHCDALVRLPMAGPMPSINVSNAAAVALYAMQVRVF